MKIVSVYHPGIQHSHHLANELNKRSLLKNYISGVPVSGSAGKKISEYFAPHVKKTTIPNDRRMHFVVFPIIRKIIGKIFGSVCEGLAAQYLDIVFDLFCAFYILIDRPKIVIGYQNASKFTFSVAKKIGIICILDCAGLYYKEIDRHKKIKKVFRKRIDAELDLARHIICCSEYSKKSYVVHNIDSKKIKVFYLGADVVYKKNKSDGHVLNIAFVGGLSKDKGFDVVLNIFLNDSRELMLRAAGGLIDKSLLTKIKENKNFQYIGFVDSVKLTDLYLKSDVLILLSKFDSFGMVVIEAMQCGCAVIVNENVGASEIVKLNKNNCGWVIKNNELQNVIDEVLKDKKIIYQKKEKAKKVAMQYTWDKYGNNISDFLGQVV